MNSQHKVQHKHVNDTYLTHRLNERKTYFTEIKDKIVQIPKQPVYHKDKLHADTYRLSSPDRDTLGSTKYNMSMYTSARQDKIDGKSSPLAMSAFHGKEHAYTYLKKRREEGQKAPTKDLVNSFFDNQSQRLSSLTNLNEPPLLSLGERKTPKTSAGSRPVANRILLQRPQFTSS